MRGTLACALILLSCAGCAGRSVTARQDAKGTVDAFLIACASGHPERALEVVVPAARDRGCPAGAPGDLRAAAVTVGDDDGSQAHAVVSVAGRRTVLELTDGAQGWRIAGR